MVDQPAANPAYLPVNGTAFFDPEIKWGGLAAKHSLLSNATVKKNGSCTPTPLVVIRSVVFD
jgi:hypothetical protein